MSFCATVLAADISQMMVKLVNQYVWVVKVFLARYVDRLLTMNVAAERLLLSPRESDSESGHVYAIMLGEKFESIFGALLNRD